MKITEKHPLPWSIGTVYEYRADILDANGALVGMVKPAPLQTNVRELAERLIVGGCSAPESPLTDEIVHGEVVDSDDVLIVETHDAPDITLAREPAHTFDDPMNGVSPVSPPAAEKPAKKYGKNPKH